MYNLVETAFTSHESIMQISISGFFFSFFFLSFFFPSCSSYFGSTSCFHGSRHSSLLGFEFDPHTSICSSFGALVFGLCHG